MHAIKTGHLFWRIARPTSRSPFRWVSRPVSVGERDVPAAGVVLRVREYRPDKSSATIVLNGGFVPESMDDRRLVNFATALAEIGFSVLTPDYPAVRTLDFDPATIEQITGVIEYVRRQSPSSDATPLIVLGLSYMGTLSLKAALRPELAHPPECVGVFGGYADFGDLMREVFCDVYRAAEVEVSVDPYGRFLVLRSALAYFDAPESERDQIRAILLAIGRQRESAEIDTAVQLLSPAGRACVEGLRQFHPERSPQRWRSIVTGSRALIEALSVTESADRLRSRLLILHSVHDHILPSSGSVALHRRFPSADIVLTTLFTHVDVHLSPRTLWSHAQELRALSRMFGQLIALQR
jgi:pimeloyl-ACP methyl ester carboxylesterase